MFKKQPTDNQLIIVTAFLVVALAFPTYRSLTEEIIDGEALASRAAISVAGGRTPASIPADVALNKALPSTPLKTLDLNCDSKVELNQKVSSSHVQFQGKSCFENFLLEDVEVSNQTNGFTASLFPRGSDGYQTDLIQLAPGENKILIRYKKRTGKSVDEVLTIYSTAL